MTRHRFACPLRWGDMDAQGHVNNAAYLDYLQEARVDFLLSGPEPLQRLLSTGVLVVSHQVEYLQPVVVGEEPLRVELWVDAVGGSRFVVGYNLFDGAALVARARTAAAPYDLAGGGLRRLTEEERTLLRAALEPAEPLRSLPPVPTDPAAGHVHPLSVRWSDLDSYGHVNNVKLYDYVQEGRIAMMRSGGGWTSDDALFLVVRQDVDYRRPMDFARTPYEVVTSVASVGNRSATLVSEVRDGSAVYAGARTVVVVPQPFTEGQRAGLERYRAC
ncbi:MAG: hypothetical protein JWP61_2306 [Friedmanniella sp.]|nr:hypothetical protein [Friedmanniella sp.]